MTLRSMLALIFAVVLAAGLIVLAVAFQAGLRSYGAATSEEAVHVRTRALGAFLSRSLFEEWQRIERAAARLSGKFDPALAAATIAGLEQHIDKVSWIGIADSSGTVLAASGGMLEGENVGQRPWFQQGLAGPFAGDVHDAVLLAKLLETNNDDPIRFVDFSAPVKDSEGRTVGVLGAHVNWRWVEELVKEAADLLHLHAFIINRGGTVVLQTHTAEGELAELRSFRSAALGVATTQTEVWPDGKSYFSTSVPQFTYGSLPPFGWSMVARLDPTFVKGAESRFSNLMLLVAAGAFVLLLVVFAAIVAILLRPLRSLAENLHRVAHGEQAPFVPELRSFKEATVLSDAAALLQTRAADLGGTAASAPSRR